MKTPSQASQERGDSCSIGIDGRRATISRMSEKVLVVRCGLVPYEEARVAQRWLEGARQEGEVPDVLLLLEHPPVYTRGRRSSRGGAADAARVVRDAGDRSPRHRPRRPRHLPRAGAAGRLPDRLAEALRRRRPRVRAAAGAGRDRGARRARRRGADDRGPDRGLDPRQPPFNGRRDEKRTPASLSGPSAAEARKIGSIGVHVSRGVTTHGLAINVNNDLQPFEWIVPCGIDNCRVTSLSRELGAEQDLDAFADTVAARFGEVFEREPVATEPAALGLDSVDSHRMTRTPG